MSTIAVDPFAVDRPGMPSGGCPAWDREYEGWLRDFMVDQETRYLDRCWPMIPDRIPFRIYQITNHLFKWCLGRAFPSGEGPNFMHKLRYVAIQFHYRRDEIVAEAERYVAELIEQARIRQLEPAGYRS